MSEQLTKEKLDELETALKVWELASAVARDAAAKLDACAPMHALHRAQLKTQALRGEEAAGAAYADCAIPLIPALLSAAREVETLRAQLREVTAERDVAREVLWSMTRTYQCPVCEATPNSSTHFGSRRRVFVIRRIVHDEGCLFPVAMGGGL